MNTLQKILLTVILLSAIHSSGKSQVMTTTDNYALIFPRSGDGFAANVLRFEKDTLVVYTTDYKYIAKKDIGKIIFHPKKESGKGFVIGSVLGTYAMNYWLGTANGQPGAYLWSNLYGGKYNSSSFNSVSPLATVGIAILGVAVGGGIGYLLDLGRDPNSEVVYIFGGSPEMQEDEWEKIQGSFTHKTRHGKLHFAISGGLVAPPVSHGYFDQLSAAGYNTSSVNNSTSNGFNNFNFSGNNSTTNLTPYQNQQAPSDFNWLRTISISYSVTDEIQAGLCYAILGQPSYVYSKENDTRDSISSSFNTLSVGQKLDVKAYYATASYDKFFGKNEECELTLTAGLGFANVNFDLNGQNDFSTDFNFNLIQQDNISIHKTYFSGMVSGSLSYYLYDAFSIGIKANYFYAGTATAGAMPLVSLNEQKLNFGSGDIGFTIGLHF